MRPTESLDPRDPWARIRRFDLFKYAQLKGVQEIKDGPNGVPPKIWMIRVLKSKGIPPPPVDMTPISLVQPGRQEPPAAVRTGPTVEVEADDLVQWPPPALSAVTFQQMKKELKAAGIKTDRTWKKDRVTQEWEKMKIGKDAS